MKKIIKAGAVDQTIDVFIQDSSSTTGAGKTGLAYNTASLVCYYRKGATGSATALTLATQTVGGAHSDGGFVEISSTNMPGMYRLDLSDTIVATAGTVTLMLSGASGMAPLPIELQVVAVDLEDGTSMGISRIDAAVTTRLAPTTAGRTLDVSAGGEAGVDWANVGSPTTSVDLSGTTIATSQQVDVNTIKTQSVTCAAGVTVLASVGTAATSTAQTGDNYARLGAPAGASIAADVAAVYARTDVATSTRLATAGYTAPPTAADNATAVLTTQMTESYRADGAAPTLAQGICETLAHLGESSISSTTKTIKKFDGSTSAATFTLDSATTPTSITRAT